MKLKGQNGITLIALIITIIVLLILAVVSINAIKGDGIIRYAKNAKNEFEIKVNAENSMLDNYIAQIKANVPGGTNESEENTPGGTAWTLSDTNSNGDPDIGEVVKHSSGEQFYVIPNDENSSDDQVTLFAMHNLNPSTGLQGVNSSSFSCSFSSDYWTGTGNLNEKEELRSDSDSAVFKAMDYASNKLGDSTGRLLTYDEFLNLVNINPDVAYGPSGAGLNYWLGTAYSTDQAWCVTGTKRDWYHNTYSFSYTWGVRPVIVISKF